jgi:hypothetical protein
VLDEGPQPLDEGGRLVEPGHAAVENDVLDRPRLAPCRLDPHEDEFRTADSAQCLRESGTDLPR